MCAFAALLQPLVLLESLRHISMSEFCDEYSPNDARRTSIILYVRLQFSEIEAEKRGHSEEEDLLLLIYFSHRSSSQGVSGGSSMSTKTNVGKAFCMSLKLQCAVLYLSLTSPMDYNPSEVNRIIFLSYPSRRHSCSLVKIPTPCITKMISHIEDVESKIQEHLKQFETSFEEWTSAMKDELEDVGVSTPEKEGRSEKARGEKCPELKKKLETLLAEAIYLVKSLETDRAEAEQALLQQKSRKRRISTKIDSWSLWKLQELPIAVQKEHESYSKDISELNIHLEDTFKTLRHLEKEKEKLEKANAKIQKDVDYMSQHGPLLELKRKVELDNLRKCYSKKFEVMELFRTVHEEFKDTLVKYETAKAYLKDMIEENERDIAHEQKTVEAYQKEVSMLSNLQDHYSTSILSANINIDEDEEAMSEMLRETFASTNEVANKMRKVNELMKLFDYFCWKQKILEQHYSEKLNSFYSSKKIWDIEISDVSKDFSDVTKFYMKLSEENKELQNNVTTLTQEIRNSIRRKTECEGEIAALVQMKAQNHSYIKQLYKKAYKIGSLYHAARDKTDAMEDQISEVRRKFKVREEFLKKRTRAEISKGIEVQKKLFSTEEFQFNEVQEFLRRKALYMLALSEVELPLRDIETELVRLKDVHRHHSDALEQIYERRLTVKLRVEATKKKLLKKRRHSRKELTKTEGRASIMHQKLESNKTKTIVFNTKCKELEKQINLMEVEKNHFEDKLEKLKDEFIKLRFDREHVQAVQNVLLEEKEMCQARVFEENKKFQKIVEMRQNTLTTIWKLQEESLEENLRLASEYQALQMMVLQEKDIYLNGYDRLLSLNDSVCVKKKSCLLHKKKDKDWETYLQMLILYYKRKVANIQYNSQDSIQKILTVQPPNLVNVILLCMYVCGGAFPSIQCVFFCHSLTHLKTAVQGYHMFCCSLKASNRSKVQERLAGSSGPNRNVFPIKLLVNHQTHFGVKEKMLNILSGCEHSETRQRAPALPTGSQWLLQTHPLGYQHPFTHQRAAFSG
ncbi:coiled-coil domain-containing protein 178 [Meriones unguiculatus]|uniref:coiled-coil domain-containing protein 178 n=1 Tax=Meriones unguiculatus TaxID=10047 RepID=UPI00293EC6E4|nr:coiled-coil domain-containing protein 178 [Meriones unguiculatus]